MRSPKLDQKYFYPFSPSRFNNVTGVTGSRLGPGAGSLLPCPAARLAKRHIFAGAALSNRGPQLKLVRHPSGSRSRMHFASRPRCPCSPTASSSSQPVSPPRVASSQRPSLPPSFCFPAESGVDRQSARYATLRGSEAKGRVERDRVTRFELRPLGSGPLSLFLFIA